MPPRSTPASSSSAQTSALGLIMDQAYVLAVGLVIGICLMNIPPALDQLGPHYQGGFLGLGVLITALLWSHALMQLPGGVLTDRLGIKFMLLAGLGFLAGGNLAAAWAPGLAAAVACRVAAGMGTGAAFLAMVKLVVQEAPPARAGVRQAYLGGFVALGSIAAFGIIPPLADLDWRWAHAAPGLAAALLIPPTWLRSMPATPPPQAWAATLFSLARRRQGWILGLLHGLSWGSVITLGNWAPSLMREATGDSTLSFAWAGAMVMGIGGLGRILGGPLLADLEPRRMARASMVLLALAMVGAWAAPGVWAPACCLLAAVVFASVNFASIFQLASEAAAPAQMGTLFGLVNLLANLGAIAFTLVCGWFKDELGSFRPAFLVMCATALAAALLAGLLAPGREAKIISQTKV